MGQPLITKHHPAVAYTSYQAPDVRLRCVLTSLNAQRGAPLSEGTLTEELIIEVPADLAGYLIAEQVARKPVTWRGADVISALTLATDLTSTMTAVIVARSSIAEFARSLAHRLSKDAGGKQDLTITIRTGSGAQVIIQANDQEGIRKLAAQITLTMDNIRKAENA
jgi:hypothetical protein